MIKQVVEFLVAGNPDNATDKDANLTSIDGVVAVMEAYIRSGDPFFGPKPLSGGLKMHLVHALSQASRAFVVAHEYAHVIVGHFDDHVMRLEKLATNAGPISVIKKDWNQEFEADIIAHKILLGVDDYAKLDVSVIDRALDLKEVSSSVLTGALKLKSAIAAPFIFLTIDAILRDVAEAMTGVTNVARSDVTHPPARARMDNLMPSISRLNPKYSGFINFAGILWAHSDEIEERLIRSLVESPISGSESGHGNDSGPNFPLL